MKNLRWDDEAWVKLYIRDPAEWLALSFDASGLLLHLWRKVDRSGAFGIGDVARAEVPELLALAFRIETSRMASALEELVRRKFVVVTKREGQQVIMVPDFEPAQSARSTDRFRQQEKRKRDRDEAISSGKRAPSSRDVTRCHTPSRIDQIRSDRSDQKEEIRSSPIGEGVQGEPREQDSNPPETTPSIKPHNGPETPARRSTLQTLQAEPATRQEATPEPLVLSPPTPEQPKAKSKTTAPMSAPKSTTEAAEHPLPPDWTPTQSHYDTGAKYGMAKYQVDFEAMAFRNHAEGCDRKQTRWNGAFSTWLLKDIKDRGDRPHRAPKPVAVEPPRSIPPPPPLHPMVAEGARKAREMMEQNPNMSLRELLDFSNVGKKYSFNDVDTVDT